MDKNYNLKRIEGVLARASELARMLGNKAKKKDRTNASKILDEIVIPQLIDIHKHEDKDFFLLGPGNPMTFHMFIVEFRDLLKKGKYQEASKFTMNYLREVRESYVYDENWQYG